MNAADARRQMETMVHRQLATAWAAGATAGERPETDDPAELAIRFAVRDRILTDAAREVIRWVQRYKEEW